MSHLRFTLSPTLHSSRRHHREHDHEPRPHSGIPHDQYADREDYPFRETPRPADDQRSWMSGRHSSASNARGSSSLPTTRPVFTPTDEIQAHRYRWSRGDERVQSRNHRALRIDTHNLEAIVRTRPGVPVIWGCCAVGCFLIFRVKYDTRPIRTNNVPFCLFCLSLVIGCWTLLFYAFLCFSIATMTGEVCRVTKNTLFGSGTTVHTAASSATTL